VTRIELLPGVLDDLTRIVEHLQRHDIEGARPRGGGIISAVAVLADNPRIGRTDKGKRGLVIGRGAHGYVALYRYVAVADTVFVLAIRAQREGGYARDE
jgi:plasmid stabilization system protein ParE